MKLRIFVRSLAVVMVAVLCFTFGGCVSDTEYEVLTEAVREANLEKLYSNTFQFTVVNADTEATVCFSQGRANIDKSNGLRMNGTMTQFILGEYSSANIAYADGEYYTEIGDSKIVIELEEDTILHEFLCGETPLFSIEDVKSLKTTSDGIHRTYTFVCRGNDEVLSKLVGEDIYKLVGIFNIDADLTEFSDVECVYVTTDAGSDSVLVSRSLSFDIAACQQLPYLPGVNVDKEDYITNIHIDCAQSYTKFGDTEVVIPDRSEYSAPGSGESEESDDVSDEESEASDESGGTESEENSAGSDESIVEDM